MNEKTILNSNSEKTKKYWSGNIRLVSDCFWCLIISLLVTISGESKRGIENAPLYFFFFFFWSWNEQHVKKRFAKWVIHILCWIVFLFAFLAVIVFIFDGWRFKSLENYGGFVMIAIFSIGIAFKYKSIMRFKKKEFLEQQDSQ